MIWDTLLFLNEHDLLDIRLHELSDVVDNWIVIQSRTTFSGKPKDLLLDDAMLRDRFPSFRDRVFLHTVEIPELDSAWDREYFSRNSLIDVLKTMAQDNDIVLMSDADEIPRVSAVSLACELAERPVVFRQRLHYYYCNTRCVEDPWWYGTKAARFDTFRSFSPQGIRNRSAQDCMVIDDAGWHFSYLGGAEAISFKLGSYAHTEFDTPEWNDLAKISTVMARLDDPFGRNYTYRPVPLVCPDYPRYLVDNVDRFAHHIYSCP